ncbi:hypothetical protein LJB42_002213 [Komagataella kurtzmanii]|nr:hypothetical protein LJB42_002213 [Komagataella kurtzmanii]
MIRQFIRRQSTIGNLTTTPNKYNSKSSAFNLKPNLPKGLYHHPAPAIPTPLQTPPVFLPEQDVRKNNNLYKLNFSIPKENIDEMPLLNETREKKYHMSKEDIARMQQLRDQGYTRKQLKEEFGCSNLFISLSTKPVGKSSK